MTCANVPHCSMHFFRSLFTNCSSSICWTPSWPHNLTTTVPLDIPTITNNINNIFILIPNHSFLDFFVLM